MPASILERLVKQRPLLLDGPMGTQLQREGVDTSLPLWSAWGLVRAPEAVLAVHDAYVAAGAEVLTTNTFRTHRRSLALAGMGARARELSDRAVALAREAAQRAAGTRQADDDDAIRQPSIWVAGSVAPLEDCFRPDLTPDAAAREREHGEIVEYLAAAGVDLLLVETMPTVREAVSAARAAVATGLPVLVGFTCDSTGHLRSGRAVEEAAREVEQQGVHGLLINCTPTHALHHALAALAPATSLPIGAYGNVGHAEDSSGWTSTDAIDPDGYVDYARRWRALGATLLGSCCGTGPPHIAALRRTVDAEC